MSIFAAPSFYNKRDQDIYNQGFFFQPQEMFSDGVYTPPTTTNMGGAAAATGINTVLNQGGVGGGGGGGIPFSGTATDLTTAFQKAVDDRQDRLTELNRPLAEAQFPSFKDTYGTFTMPDGRVVSNIENAQKLYNQASGYIQEGMDPNTIAASNFSYKGVTDPTIGQIKDMAADQIEDFREKYRTGQFGPSFIEAEEPTLNRKIQDAFYSLPFLSKPQSADQIIEEGYSGKVGAPGILGAILGSMDKFGTLSRGDQAFIQRNMGYTGPTVFGENTTGGAKDPFGLNVRSGRGNYAERVGVESEKLGNLLSDRMTEKYGKGTSGISFNTATGMFEAIDPEDQAAINAAIRATQMNRMNIAKYQYYTEKTKERDEDRAAAAAAEEEARQQRIDNERAAGRIANQQMQRQEGGGGGGNLTRSRAQGGLGLSAAQAQAVSEANRKAGMGGYGLADGGRVAYMMGGLADLVDIYD